MKPEAQRTAIAEACGWVTDCGYENSIRDNAFFGSNPSQGIKWKRCPDYLNDLNAMHEAEKVLAESQYYDFRQYLKQITMHTKIFMEEHKRAVITATATQRAEAFLRTIGKWEESK